MKHILEELMNGTILLLKYAPDEALYVTHEKGDSGYSGWITLPMEYNNRTIIQTPYYFITPGDAEDHMHHIIAACREMIL